MDSVKLDEASSYTLTIRAPASIEWAPKEDITAFELALSMPVLFGSGRMSYPEDVIRTLPETVKRHFAIIEQGSRT